MHEVYFLGKHREYRLSKYGSVLCCVLLKVRYCISVLGCVCVFICKYMHTHVCIYIYIHINIHM